MASAIEVVSEAERELVPQVLLKRKVCLLRVGINKIFRLRVTEGLKCQRKERGRIQVILVQEQTRIKCVKALLVRGVARNAREAGAGG